MYLRLLLALCWLSLAPLAEATTYYVTTSGSDTTGNGSVGNPWRNPQKCFSAGTPLVAGDTCLVGDGTYTTTTTGRTVLINSSSPNGTISAPVTLKSQNPLGATIQAPDTWPGVNCNATGTSCPFTGVYISGRSYYVIEGFNFTRPGSNYYTNAATAGISAWSTTGVVIKNNRFTNIGRNVCHNGTLGQGGIFANDPINMVIEKNQFDTIGRRRNGELGCSTTIFHHDHGIYVVGSTDLTIRRNICYDVNRGFCINLKANGSTPQTLRAKIYHNVFSEASPTGQPEGVIALTNVLNDVQIKNNIFHDPTGGKATWWYTSSSTAGAGVILTNNITNSTATNDSFSQPYLRPATGVTSSSNTFSASLGFVDATNHNYNLTSSSAAIGAGTALSGYTYNGTPDMGPYETFTASSAAITNTTVRVNFGMGLNTPIVPSGTTGWSIACSPSCGTLSVSSVALASGTTDALDVTVSGWSGGTCLNTQTITISYATTGGVRDSATIAETHQRLNALTTYAVTNNCPVSPNIPPNVPTGLTGRRL